MAIDPIRTVDLLASPQTANFRLDARRAKLSERQAPADPAASQRITANDNQRNEVKVEWDRDDGVIVKFTDKKSGEVVRQVPSEQVQSVMKFIREMLKNYDTASTTDSQKTE